MKRRWLILFAALLAAPLVVSQVRALLDRLRPFQPIDLESLGSFPLDTATGTNQDVPARLRALNGRRVTLKGFMYSPGAASDDVSSFQFVYTMAESHEPPTVQGRVFAKVPFGRTVPYYDGLVRLEGTLHVNVQKNTGLISSVYTLDVHRVAVVENGSEALELPEFIASSMGSVGGLGILIWCFAWLFLWLRRRYAGRAGLCRRCGYDLRATPWRCPECGEVCESSWQGKML